MLNFRKLEKEEISARVASCGIKGQKAWAQLLLYTDARVVADVLDEAVGKLNWSCAYSNDNANCTISVWDSEKEAWVSKENVGTESYAEAEKGKASDSFKRAAVMWGVSRELYSSPFIYTNKIQVEEKNGSFKSRDRFTVTAIGYDDKGRISHLEIFNESLKTQAYLYDRPVTANKSVRITETDTGKAAGSNNSVKGTDDDTASADASSSPITAKQLQSLKKKLESDNIPEEAFKKYVGVNDLSELSQDAVKLIAKTWKDTVIPYFKEASANGLKKNIA